MDIKTYGIANYVSTSILDEKGYMLDMIEESKLKEHIIPSCTLQQNDAKWSVIFEEGDFKIDYSESENEIVYKNEISKTTEWDILFLVRQTLERQLQDMGYLTIHASAIGLGDKGIIIAGPSGSGKTSLILHAASGDWHFIANESTVISSRDLKIVAGTNLISFKEDLARRFFPHLLEIGFSPVPGVRVIYPADIFGSRVTSKISSKLIVYPKICFVSLYYYTNRNILRSHLYRSASRFITGNFLFNSLSRLVPINLDTQVCQELR